MSCLVNHVGLRFLHSIVAIQLSQAPSISQGKSLQAPSTIAWSGCRITPHFCLTMRIINGHNAHLIPGGPGDDYAAPGLKEGYAIVIWLLKRKRRTRHD